MPSKSRSRRRNVIDTSGSDTESDGSVRRSSRSNKMSSKNKKKSRSKSRKKMIESSDDESSVSVSSLATVSDLSSDDESTDASKTTKKRRSRNKSRKSKNKKGSDLDDDSKNEEGSANEPDITEDKIRRTLRSKLLSNGGSKLRHFSALLRRADKNGEGWLSKNKFKSVVFSKMSKGADSITKLELHWLLVNLKGRVRNHIMYDKLKDILTDGEVAWDEDGDNEGWKGLSTERWAVQPGSVGEWLQNVATPLDRRNFKDFMVVLEDFERSRGVDSKRTVEMQGNSIVVRLGPMVNVAMKFYVE